MGKLDTASAHGEQSAQSDLAFQILEQLLGNLVGEQLEETDDVRDGRIVMYGELHSVPIGALGDMSPAGGAYRSLAVASYFLAPTGVASDRDSLSAPRDGPARGT